MPKFMVITREKEGEEPIQWNRRLAVIDARDMDEAKATVRREWFGFSLDPLTLHETNKARRVYREEGLDSVTIYEITSILLRGVDYGPGVEVLDVPMTFQSVNDLLNQGHPVLKVGS